MDAVGDIAEIQELARLFEAENVVHGLRPEDPAARYVPVPQTAMAAVERLVEPLGGDGERAVGFRRLGRLPVEGAAQHHEHEEGDGEQHAHLHDAVLPGAHDIAMLLDDEQAAGQRRQVTHADIGLLARCERQAGHLRGVDVNVGDEAAGEHIGDGLPGDRPVGFGADGDYARGIDIGEDAPLALSLGQSAASRSSWVNGLGVKPDCIWLRAACFMCWAAAVA